MKKSFLKAAKYLILGLVVGCILLFIVLKHNVEFVFVNSTTNKIPELALYIDESFHSKFYCAPGMIPSDFIEVKLPLGKHSIRVESSNPTQSWTSTFWVMKNEFYQFYMGDNLGQSDTLIINFEKTFFPPIFQ